MLVDSKCPRCGTFQESVTHALLACKEVKRWWFDWLLEFKIDIRDDSDFVEWFGNVLHIGDEVATKVYELLYPIWQARNLLIFYNNDTHLNQLLYNANSLQSHHMESTSNGGYKGQFWCLLGEEGYWYELSHVLKDTIKQTEIKFFHYGADI